MRKKIKLVPIISVIFSLLQAIGLYLYQYNSFSIIGESYLWMKFVAFFLCSYVLICCCLYGFRFFYLKIVTSYINRKSNVEKQVNDKRVCVITFFIISLCWAPWLIAFYPGSVYWDMTYQLEQYYGYLALQFHPPFSTLIAGKCVDLGKLLFGFDNRGIFIYTMLQFFVCAAACTASVKELVRMNIPRWVVYVAISFYSAFPFFGATVQCVMKDTVNYGLTLLAYVMILRLYNNISETQSFKKTNVLLFSTFSLLSCLYRKEMIYVFLLVLVALGIYAYIKSSKIRTLLILIPVLVLVLLSGTITNKTIARGYFGQEFFAGSSEGLSIPLQFVARVAKYHDDTLSEEEKMIIGECFPFGYEGVSQSYNPYLSDPIKNSFNNTKAKENGFWELYWKLLKKNPFVFLESICAGGYGYFSIVPNVPTTVDDAPTNGLPGGRIPSLYINIGVAGEYGNLNISFHDSTSEFRNFLGNYILAFQLPYNLLYSFGFYTWVVILLVCMVMRKSNIFAVIPFIPIILLIAVCVMSPVNDYGRYYMGIIFAIPLLAGYSLELLINK